MAQKDMKSLIVRVTPETWKQYSTFLILTGKTMTDDMRGHIESCIKQIPGLSQDGNGNSLARAIQDTSGKKRT